MVSVPGVVNRGGEWGPSFISPTCAGEKHYRSCSSEPVRSCTDGLEEGLTRSTCFLPCTSVHISAQEKKSSLPSGARGEWFSGPPAGAQIHGFSGSTLLGLYIRGCGTYGHGGTTVCCHSLLWLPRKLTLVDQA